MKLLIIKNTCKCRLFSAIRSTLLFQPNPRGIQVSPGKCKIISIENYFDISSINTLYTIFICNGELHVLDNCRVKCLNYEFQVTTYYKKFVFENAFAASLYVFGQLREMLIK